MPLTITLDFTRYGLERLFRKAGFEDIHIEPRGGFFWLMADRLKQLPKYLREQYRLKSGYSLKRKLIGLALWPLYVLSIPFCTGLIPLIYFYLDGLDRKRDFTLGYGCVCVKGHGAADGDSPTNPA